MKNYLAGTRGGHAKEEGGSKHQHQHTQPEAGKPWKNKGRENGGRRKRKRNKTSEGGEDGSAWTNLPQRNLRLPRHAQDPTYLGSGGLVGEKGEATKFIGIQFLEKKSCVAPSKGR